MLQKERIDYNLDFLEREYCPLKRKNSLFKILEKYFGDFLPHYLKPSDEESVFDLYNGLFTFSASSERIIKSKLASDLFESNLNIAFEVNCLDSRLDLLAFDENHTISFEIKSRNDNLYKLEKQVNTYIELFDYNYAVIDEKHLKDASILLPDCVGIIIFENVSGKINLDFKKQPKKSCNNPLLQVDFFTKMEKKNLFSNISDQEIVNTYGKSLIRQAFLEAITKRFKKKSNFLKENIDSINQIDYQFFFKNNIEPELIYRR